MHNSLQYFLNLARQAFLEGNFSEADRLASQVLLTNPNTPEGLLIRGVVAGCEGRYVDAEILLKQAAKLERNSKDIFFNLAKSLSEQDKDDEAIEWHRKAIALDERHQSSWLNYGRSLYKLGLLDKAMIAFDHCLKLNPNFAEAYVNKANCLQERNLSKEALNLSEKAICLNPQLFEAWNSKGVSLSKLGYFDEAVKNFNEALSLFPNYADAWSNLGNVLGSLSKFEEALKALDRSVNLRPNYAEAWNNRGLVIQALGAYQQALDSFDRAIKLKFNYPEAWRNRAIPLNSLRLYDEAIFSYKRALELNPHLDFCLGDLMHTQMKICDWSDFETRIDALKKGITEGQKVSSPFAILGLFDSPELQKNSAEIYVEERLKKTGQLGEILKKSAKEKIRVGYFSMDFREHPVSYLIADLIELHNRNKFEIYGFSFGANTRDSLRQRLEKSFDKFFDVRDQSEIDIARLSRQLEVDIAIDLGGHTQDSRPRIFIEQAAPIQIGFLGYPGTFGSACMDYFVGDRVAVTERNLQYFSEKIIFLPNSFQVNPSYRKIADVVRTKESYGLPKDSFVFCCFNNPWKITPQVFKSWMEILRRVPNSVLWLTQNNSGIEKNLRDFAADNGIESARLIFTQRVKDISDHYRRYLAADLFLDTYPFGAHTTASDALWAGLPVLTLQGQSFAARVASSLLTNINIPELITCSKEEYCLLAIELALNPAKLALIRAKLARNRSCTPLFNVELYVRQLESAYQVAYDRYCSGLKPEHMYILGSD